VAAAAAITCSCGPATAPAIDPGLASCVTSGAVLIAGLDLDRLRASPLYPKLTPVVGMAIEPLGNASKLLVTWDGKSFVFVARGKFREAPAGATLIDSTLAISGPAEAVRGAIARHKTGITGAPDLLGRAASVAGSAEIWAAVRGRVTLPLTGNAANLNRLLHQVDYFTFTAKLGARIDLDLTGASRTADEGQRLEETLRAIVSLTEAASPRLEPILQSVQVRREGPIVHVILPADADAVGQAVDALTR